MAKKCTGCGQEFTGDMYPAAATQCTSCETKQSCKKHVRRTCNEIPAGLSRCSHRSGCGCSECQNVIRQRVISVDLPCAKGGVDEIAGDTFTCDTPVPGRSTQCRPFTKDVFALIDRTFGFPAVNSEAYTEITNVMLGEGQPITHPDYGTLIAHPVLGSDIEYRLENAAYLANPLDAIGKPIPCGKKFYLGFQKPAPLDNTVETLECNSLLEDFTVPAVNATANAVVRTYVGLNIDDHVVIRNKVDPNLVYTFRISGATGTNTLILENEGDGGTVGAVYTAAAEVEGEYAWCVDTIENLSACAQSAETLCMTHILGCDDNGNPRKLTGSIENEAPVYDPTCDGFQLKVIPKPISCVLLSSCFQIAHVSVICNRTPIIITTQDDQRIIDDATAALLSHNANPLITICGYVFSLDLGVSVVGALSVTPNFNPDTLLSFDQNCKVCIPEDCCFQCNPQVNYPVESYNPPGLNKSLNVNIPASIVTGFGEYKMSVVKHPDTGADLLFVHDNNTNLVTAGYDTNGNPVVLADLPGDPNEYTYNSIYFCNNNVCPVDVNYEEDINVRFYDLILGEEISFNYHTQFDVYNCYEVGSPGQALTSTQYGVMGHFVGPSHTSEIAFGTEPFGQVVPDVLGGGFKTYDAISNHKKRTFALFYPTCVRISTVATILLRVSEEWEAIVEDWVYLSGTSVTVATGAADRYAVNQEVIITQATGGYHRGIISAITDTTLAFTGAGFAITNEPIVTKFRRYIRGNKLLQMETTSMLRTQNI